MAHSNQTNQRRSSSLCHLHPPAKPSAGFCASCLRERLVTVEAQSSSPSVVRTPDLRRIRSSSVRNPTSTASVSEQPRRRSCDVRSSVSSLHELFVDDDEERLGNGSSIRKPLVLEDGVEINNGEHKTMKEFIDLDWGKQIKKNNGKDLNEIASVFSRTLKKFSLKRNDDELDGRFNGIGIRPRSCDIDPRLSFEKPRASWDGCLIEKTYHKLLTPLSTVTEDAKTTLEEEKSPGGTVQTRNYYSDSRRRRSFEQSILIKSDELKAISNAVGLFHGAKLLVTEKELRDSNWYSTKGNTCNAASVGKRDSVEFKKPKKKWPTGWSIWGLIQRKHETNKEIKTEQSLELEGNAIEGSLAESLLKLRRVGKGETNGNGVVSEKLMRSYSVSARKSCDGVFSGFEGGRSSCDGLFQVGRSSCDGLVNVKEGKQNGHLHQRKANDGMYGRENVDNSLCRLYLSPVKSHKTRKSGKSRMMS